LRAGECDEEPDDDMLLDDLDGEWELTFDGKGDPKMKRVD
jgi:hypothetical protein